MKKIFLGLMMMTLTCFVSGCEKSYSGAGGTYYLSIESTNFGEKYDVSIATQNRSLSLGMTPVRDYIFRAGPPESLEGELILKKGGEKIYSIALKNIQWNSSYKKEEKEYDQHPLTKREIPRNQIPSKIIGEFTAKIKYPPVTDPSES